MQLGFPAVWFILDFSMLTVKCDNSDLYWNKHKTRQVMMQVWTYHRRNERGCNLLSHQVVPVYGREEGVILELKLEEEKKIHKGNDSKHDSQTWVWDSRRLSTLTKSSFAPSLLVRSFCRRPSSSSLPALDTLGFIAGALCRMLLYISAVFRL